MMGEAGGEDLPYRLVPIPVAGVVGAGRWWRCRWCGMGERGLLVSVKVEARRALAHEAECRPGGQ